MLLRQQTQKTHSLVIAGPAFIPKVIVCMHHSIRRNLPRKGA